MFYHYQGAQHSTTFFNRTIDIVEPAAFIDFQALFLIFLILAALGGLGTDIAAVSQPAINRPL